MIYGPSLWGAIKDLAENNVWHLTGSGAPTNGTSGTGVNLAGPGSTYTDTATGYKYNNTGTMASPVWVRSQYIANTQAAIASTTTIAPTATVFHVSGTAAIATITPPASDFLGAITLIPDAAFTTVTTGNIMLASTGVVNKALIMTYDGAKWYPSY